MNERQQLEAEYDKAKEDLENAAADLSNTTIRAIVGTSHTGQSNANCDLRKTVAKLAKSHFDLPEARANLARAQVNCHRTMLAIEDFDRAQTNQWSTQSSEYRVRSVARRQTDMGHGKIFSGSFALPLRNDFLVPSGKPARALLVKRSVMLLALVLAFLQYYLLDAQLQIERLPVSKVCLSSQLRPDSPATPLRRGPIGFAQTGRAGSRLSL
jgi:hypothetical protein